MEAASSKRTECKNGEAKVQFVSMNASVQKALQRFAPHVAHVNQVRLLQGDFSERSYVVCVKEEVVVKRSRDERSLTEVETMTFVAEHTSIPIPRLFGTHLEENGGRLMVMEFIPGETLWSALPRLSNLEKKAIGLDLKNYLDELRYLLQSYIGAVGKKPFVCDILMRVKMDGPFETEAEFNEFLVELYTEEKPQSHFGFLLRKLLTFSKAGII